MSATQTLFVTGATGKLGRLVIDALLEINPAERIVAGVRDLAHEGATAIRAQGVETRLADYDRPETLARAFRKVGRLLLISSHELGHRTAQHRNVIAAAQNAGVGLLAYTSLLRADTSPLSLAADHRDTEAALQEAGVPHALLRNGWYTEVFTSRLPLAFKHDVLIGAAGDGRVSTAARADYAAAAAAVLASGDHAGAIYELAGDRAFTLAELVDVVTKVAGRPIVYRNMTAEEFRLGAMEAGVPAMFATILADTDAGLARGALFDDGGALARLIGRPTTPFQSTITDFVKTQL